MKSAQSIEEPSLKQQAIQHIGDYSKLVDHVDTCSYLEQMEARIVQLEADKHKLEAEKEVRAWIYVARELISKDLKPRFPNAFPQIKGNIIDI